MTEVAEPSIAGGRPARTPRRSPTDLPFSFLTREHVDALASERDEPAWLRDDRLAALEAFQALPVEANRLYTPYVDLRAASLDGVAPYVRTGVGVPDAAATPPEDEAGLVELREDGVGACALSAGARAAGVRLLTLGELVRTDDALARELLAGGPLLPVDEKLAQLARAAWSQGVVIHVPAASAWIGRSSCAGSRAPRARSWGEC
jgi:Fe-S cluster assembly scaffold protein SufB